MSINELSKLELHDQDLVGLEINLSSQELTLKIDSFNDEKKDYDLLILKFQNVQQFNFTDSIPSFLDVEINSIKITSLLNQNFKIDLTLILNFSGPSLLISFICSDCSVILEKI